MRGCTNFSADGVSRKDETWSDGKLNEDFTSIKMEFVRLVCEECKSTLFEVLQTDSYQTSARCAHCGRYYIVHCG